jgi:poly(3-hydroxyalkanoate) synthetase
MAQQLEALEPVMKITETLPVDALQMLFNLAEPHSVGDKYREFGTTDQSSERARSFVAFEDWLNDGIPLAAPIARQTLGEWFGENRPARGLWQVAGEVVDPARLRVPSLVALAERDRIVLPESGLPLAARLPNCTLLRPKAGHVGMIAGSSAEAALWGPLANWARNITSAGFAKQAARSRVRRRRGDTAKENPE